MDQQWHTQANGTVSKYHSDAPVLLSVGELAFLGHHEPSHHGRCSLFLRIRPSRSASSCLAQICAEPLLVVTQLATQLAW